MSAALLHIKQIPTERVESIELELEPGEIGEMMVELGDYELDSPEDFGVTVRVQRVGELTVRLMGEARARLAYTCGRCLERCHVDVEAPFEYVLIPKPAWSERYEGMEEVALGEDDLDLDSYWDDNNRILRYSVVFSLNGDNPYISDGNGRPLTFNGDWPIFRDDYTPWPSALRVSMVLHDSKEVIEGGRTVQFTIPLPRSVQDLPE